MKRVRRKDTAPELAVRRRLHARGLRFRLHDRSLPGTPDLVFKRRATVVFVHGCFWHGHECRHGAVRPKTNAAFWARKIADNRARDRRKSGVLRALGWHVEVVWECQARDSRCIDRLGARLMRR